MNRATKIYKAIVYVFHVIPIRAHSPTYLLEQINQTVAQNKFLKLKMTINVFLFSSLKVTTLLSHSKDIKYGRYFISNPLGQVDIYNHLQSCKLSENNRLI